ncbi:hypothetical protein G7Z17_g3428 [Cylindrodendrum hubeiense]|uniref:Uncharacterized protein n=1 Tax=Cylindrodendrum hubeiense TaxID=595255 RepID=A0A9P5HAU9_9HYPO|nr:hypothetical protein G7Z17_g3428 [Cylindrodendrum hubeiense]
MSQPTAPSVSIDNPAFRYGPTVLQPVEQPDPKSPDPVDGNPDVTSLDVLKNFTGTFGGFGFNTIFRPNSKKTPTPKENTDDNVLQLNLTSETMTFGNPLGDVPNRGLDNQPDIMLDGVPYTQTIVDTTEILKDQKPPIIHFEPGLWMRVPGSEMPGLQASFVRMASIPHGTTINAQCFEPAVTSKGSPTIPEVSIMPRSIADGQEQPFTSQDASNNSNGRIPQKLGPFIKDGTITEPILKNPNKILVDANNGKEIIESTTFTVSTTPAAPELGGGTSNIGFLIGADSGVALASVSQRSGNANAVKVTAQYWVSKVRAKIDLQPCCKMEYKTVSPAASHPRDAIPMFVVDFDVTSAKTVTVEYTQIQYSQNVILDFNSLSWPHISVATLAPTGLSLKSVIVDE